MFGHLNAVYILLASYRTDQLANQARLDQITDEGVRIKQKPGFFNRHEFQESRFLGLMRIPSTRVTIAFL